MSHWAAIFDFDGTLVDSVSYQAKSWAMLAEEEGFAVGDEYLETGFGRTNIMTIREVFGWTSDETELKRLATRKEQIYQQLIRDFGIDAIDGAEELLHYLHRQRVPIAIASMGPRETIEQVFEHIKLKNYVDAIISEEDVTESKPSPQVFSRAAAKLSMQPKRCVVFEDAPVGVQAARNLGMRVVGIASSHGSSHLGGADVVVHSLKDVRPDAISAWFLTQADEVSRGAPSVRTRSSE